MRLHDEKVGYDYIWIHVDDLKLIAKDPSIWIDQISAVLLIKEHGTHKYYLGDTYNHHDG